MRVYLGLDVSKNDFDAILLTDDQGQKKWHKKFANSVIGFGQLIAWAEHHSQVKAAELQAVMEATGPYHEALALALYEAGAVVSVINPKRLKDFASSLGLKAKNDALDAFAIARYGQMLQPAPWHPEPPEYRQLKQLLRRLDALETDRQRERNRLEKNRISTTSTAVLASIERSLAFLDTEYQCLNQAIDDHIDAHPTLQQDRQYLASIPSIGPTLSARMIALLHHGQRFANAAQFASYLGVIPTEHQSGSSVLKRPHLSKLGPARERAKLYMAALGASRYNPDVKALYQRLIEHGKCPKVALGAAMRKLAQICFGVIKHQTYYQPQIVSEA